MTGQVGSKSENFHTFFHGLRHRFGFMLCGLLMPLLPQAQSYESYDSPAVALATSPLSQSSRNASITIASRCEGSRQIAAQIYGDSIVVGESEAGGGKNQVVILSGKKRQSADSLFQLLKGLGGALVLRCPNVEAVSCQFEATLDRNRLECTNCAACSEDLDRMSLTTLHRFKALLRELNLFL
jgi:hypothetical protein